MDSAFAEGSDGCDLVMKNHIIYCQRCEFGEYLVLELRNLFMLFYEYSTENFYRIVFENMNFYKIE